jgi:hypothetical protein
MALYVDHLFSFLDPASSSAFGVSAHHTERMKVEKGDSCRKRMIPQALVVVLALLHSTVIGFSVSPSSSPSISSSSLSSARKIPEREKAGTGAAVLYGVPGSGWASPKWNWGYAAGTGHDCARICRNKYQSRPSRAQLMLDLQNAGRGDDIGHATDLEEIKLILALAWQRGRWDGSDGGPGGYGEVLSHMAEAVRYEIGDAVECRRRLLGDMQSRFATLQPSDTAMERVSSFSLSDEDVDSSLRVCSGYVLQAMGFVEVGL